MFSVIAGLSQRYPFHPINSIDFAVTRVSVLRYPLPDAAAAGIVAANSLNRELISAAPIQFEAKALRNHSASWFPEIGFTERLRCGGVFLFDRVVTVAKNGVGAGWDRWRKMSCGL